MLVHSYLPHKPKSSQECLYQTEHTAHAQSILPQDVTLNLGSSPKPLAKHQKEVGLLLEGWLRDTFLSRALDPRFGDVVKWYAETPGEGDFRANSQCKCPGVSVCFVHSKALRSWADWS